MSAQIGPQQRVRSTWYPEKRHIGFAAPICSTPGSPSIGSMISAFLLPRNAIVSIVSDIFQPIQGKFFNASSDFVIDIGQSYAIITTIKLDVSYLMGLST
jgi:hypothetical protein